MVLVLFNNDVLGPLERRRHITHDARNRQEICPDFGLSLSSNWFTLHYNSFLGLLVIQDTDVVSVETWKEYSLEISLQYHRESKTLCQCVSLSCCQSTAVLWNSLKDVRYSPVLRDQKHSVEEYFYCFEIRISDLVGFKTWVGKGGDAFNIK